nr:hypothetical protein [Micromonospora sp. DSM 115978]
MKKGVETFSEVGGLEQSGVRGVTGCPAGGLVGREFLARDVEGRSHGERGVGDDPVGEREGAVEGAAGLGEVVDEPEAFGTFGGEVVAGGEHFESDVAGQRTGGTKGTAEVGHETAFDFGKAERSGTAGDDHVAAQDEFDAAAEREAFDGGDQWFGESAASNSS